MPDTDDITIETDLNIAITEEPEDEEPDLLRYEITSYPSDMTLEVYFNKWNNKQLTIPPFQRKYVWNIVQASKLIESFLIGIPVPGVFLYKEHKTNKLLVIDGQQRIQSIIHFFKGLFADRAFRLKNVREPWNGKSYEELTEKDKYQLKDSILRATVVQQLSPEDDSSIYYIFERLNTGGEKLTPMEIRKCLYSGPFYNLLEKLNMLAEWRLLIGQEKINKRLRDVELILRILALAENWRNYEKPMKGFLNDYMINKKNLTEEKINPVISKMGEYFQKTCEIAFQHLGEKPFHLKNRLNLGLMDSIMATIYNHLQHNHEQLFDRFEDMIQDSDFIKSVTISTSDTSVVSMRFKLAKNFLYGIEEPS